MSAPDWTDAARPAPTVVKLGGELLEEPSRLAAIAGALARLSTTTPLVVVHGGGREIDAELSRRQIPRQMVDGLRVTDAATLDAVVSVLAGAVNTRLVAALHVAGARPVGLTGADAGVGVVEKAEALRTVDGRLVDLGLVGAPIGADRPALLDTLLANGFTPALACIGMSREGQLFNVNADTLAAHLAGRVSAERLVIAGATAGVLDGEGQTIPALDLEGVDRLIDAGGATAGMVAKLGACRAALAAGVREVLIVDGRVAAHIERPTGTRITRAMTPA